MVKLESTSKEAVNNIGTLRIEIASRISRLTIEQLRVLAEGVNSLCDQAKP